jgi:hypothetical protein
MVRGNTDALIELRREYGPKLAEDLLATLEDHQEAGLVSCKPTAGMPPYPHASDAGLFRIVLITAGGWARHQQ